MKKKYFASKKDKKEWSIFTKQLNDIYDKEANFVGQDNQIKKIQKLDLHGFSLNEANKEVKKFINESFNSGYKKLLVVTGKGLRSKVYNDPYRSEKMNILKYSVPEYIENDEELASKINSISSASLKDGGEGAIYILLKKKLENKF